MTPSDIKAYAISVLKIYNDLPDTPSRSSPADRALAREWYEKRIPLSLVEGALLLGSLRRLVRPRELPRLSSIRSLAYFQSVVTELVNKPPPDNYLDYLRHKFQRAMAALPPRETPLSRPAHGIDRV